MIAEWDLGLAGASWLLVYALAFGLVAMLLLRRYYTGWLVGLNATAAYFAAGVLISEWWFGWATGEDLQPNIDGLSRDETLLATLGTEKTPDRRRGAASMSRMTLVSLALTRRFVVVAGGRVVLRPISG